MDVGDPEVRHSPLLKPARHQNALNKLLHRAAVPQIAGSPSPAYPENPPDPKNSEDEEDFEKEVALWTKKAKIFVEFYALLFLTIDDEGLPRDPTMPHVNILPWDPFTYLGVRVLGCGDRRF